mgnify:CR=1 FL=1
MTDSFANNEASLSSPAEKATAITPNDSADLANATRGLYVGVSGNVKLTLVGGTTVTFANLAAGTIHPLRVQRIHDTDTTATGLIGVW